MAITIDISTGGNGTYALVDDGIPGNGTSVIRGPGGAVFATIVHPSDLLTILSRAGQSINVDILDTFAADLTIGSTFSPSVRPDVINVGAISTSGKVTLGANMTI